MGPLKVNIDGACPVHLLDGKSEICSFRLTQPSLRSGQAPHAAAWNLVQALL